MSKDKPSWCNYTPVKREDIDLNETYCIWITDEDYCEIGEEELKHYKETGHLYHEGAEVGEEARYSLFKDPVYINPEPRNDHEVTCPFCGNGFNCFDEDVFDDELCNDSGPTEIECPSCSNTLQIVTHCTYRFEIDGETWEEAQ